jgi:hypothetical protein
MKATEKELIKFGNHLMKGIPSTMTMNEFVKEYITENLINSGKEEGSKICKHRYLIDHYCNERKCRCSGYKEDNKDCEFYEIDV